jgi:hypothetical protein
MERLFLKGSKSHDMCALDSRWAAAALPVSDRNAVWTAAKTNRFVSATGI